MKADRRHLIEGLSNKTRAAGILAALGVATVKELSEALGGSEEDIERARKYYLGEDESSEETNQE